MKVKYSDFPEVGEVKSYKEFAHKIHEQTLFLEGRDNSSEQANEIERLNARIAELESTVKSRDQKIEADQKLIQAHLSKECLVSELQSEVGQVRSEKTSELSMMKT